MIKHILLWKFTDSVKQSDYEEKIIFLRQNFSALLGKVNGLIEIELGAKCIPGDYDIVLYAKFDSLESLQLYQEHPLHLKIKEQAKDWVCSRACIDYEV